uniref:Cyclin N-terminal domain-containing protein n=1 Tax=Plectus sambesii TaxID=2011161 RepID=A0A914VKH8_9BILA
AVRRRLIDWMEMTAQTIQSKRGRPLALSSITLHLAVYLFDIYVDRTPHLDSSNIHLIAAVSLRLAAKLEEHEARVPHPDMLNLMIQRDLGSAM